MTTSPAYAPVEDEAPTMRVPATTFRMGSNTHYREEAPERYVKVESFQIELFAVTNRRFAAFVADTGHVTTAERPLSTEELDVLPESLHAPGSLVFTMPDRPVPLTDHRHWWRFVPGACWHCPEGMDSNLDGRDGHPVVQISFEDARAYACWAGRTLPTESEWECAARDDFVGDPPDSARANTWQGRFPFHHSRVEGPPFTLPVDVIGPGASGLHQMIGNVWEWTLGHEKVPSVDTPAPCCMPGEERAGGAPRVLKGGSFLCAESYCRRYRPQARSLHDAGSASNHIGFRCVLRG